MDVGCRGCIAKLFNWLLIRRHTYGSVYYKTEFCRVGGLRTWVCYSFDCIATLGVVVCDRLFNENIMDVYTNADF